MTRVTGILTFVIPGLWSFKEYEKLTPFKEVKIWTAKVVRMREFQISALD